MPVGPDTAPATEPSRAAVLEALVQLMFPTSSWGPGATELDVAGTVAALVDSPAGRGADSYRHAPFVQAADAGHGWQWPVSFAEGFDHGLDVLADWAVRTHGRPFADLTDDQAQQAVSALEADALPGFELIGARAFFDLLLGYLFDALFVAPTLGGYSMDEVWDRLGITGSRP